MKKLKIKGVLLFALVICMLVGCGKQTKENTASKKTKDTVVFTDALNRKVEVSNPKRVATLMGSFTDIWMLSGGKVVATGQDSWSNFDLNLSKNVVNIGSLLQPDTEKLIAAKPDFVIASSNLKSNLKLKDTLTDAGITVAYFNIASFDDYLKMLDICTKITGQRDKYNTYGTKIEKQIKTIKKRADGSNPSVLYLRATSRSVEAKTSDDNVGSQILKDLGCKNIADSNQGLLDELSMEAIVKENPDYIFVTQIGKGNRAVKQLTSNPTWKSLKAVKNGNYYVLDKALYHSKPNARWGEAYEKLADILYK